MSLGATLSGCNDSSTGSANAAGASASGTSGSGTVAGSTGGTTGGTTGSTTGQGATIQGTAAATAVVGKAYSFQPQVSGASSTAVTYTIANKPAWATFNAATGQLSGTPVATDVGTDAGIEISATDAGSVIQLPAFTISVSAAVASNSSVSLAWVAPTQNSDGTPLVDLKGYTIHYGSTSQDYTGSISVTNPTVTTYLVNSLPAGKYYFAVTALNSAGLESLLSDEVSATFN